jgi:hypothetical protein
MCNASGDSIIIVAIHALSALQYVAGFRPKLCWKLLELS